MPIDYVIMGRGHRELVVSLRKMGYYIASSYVRSIRTTPVI